MLIDQLYQTTDGKNINKLHRKTRTRNTIPVIFTGYRDSIYTKLHKIYIWYIYTKFYSGKTTLQHITEIF